MIKIAEKIGFYVQNYSRKTHKMLRNQIVVKEQGYPGWRDQPWVASCSHHGAWCPWRPACGSSCPGPPPVSFRCFFLNLLKLWYLPWYARVGSFWTLLAIFFDPQWSKKHLLITCLGLVNLNSANAHITS